MLGDKLPKNRCTCMRPIVLHLENCCHIEANQNLIINNSARVIANQLFA